MWIAIQGQAYEGDYQHIGPFATHEDAERFCIRQRRMETARGMGKVLIWNVGEIKPPEVWEQEVRADRSEVKASREGKR